MRQALVGRSVVDQARGVLMAVVVCGPEEALRVLVEVSQHTNIKLRLVAGMVVDSTCGLPVYWSVAVEMGAALDRITGRMPTGGLVPAQRGAGTYCCPALAGGGPWGRPRRRVLTPGGVPCRDTSGAWRGVTRGAGARRAAGTRPRPLLACRGGFPGRGRATLMTSGHRHGASLRPSRGAKASRASASVARARRK